MLGRAEHEQAREKAVILDGWSVDEHQGPDVGVALGAS